jgi:antitoxin CptB
MTAELDPRRRRAAYRAHHRGTKEMDILLGRYADARLKTMDEQALAEFEALLVAPDPDLQVWIMDAGTVPDDRFAGLVAELRAFHRQLARKD